MTGEDDSSSIATSLIEESSTGEGSVFSGFDDSITSNHFTPRVVSTRSLASFVAIRSRSSHAALMGGATPVAKGDGSWHHSFEVPWSKVPSSTTRLLDAGKKPSTAERREIIRIMVAEILTLCTRPKKKHVTEVVKKIVIRYPKSFRDEFDGRIIGTGYDSLVKQFMYRIDNYRRLLVPRGVKRVSNSDDPDDAKKECKDAYEPELPAGETEQSQMQKQEELMKMFKNKEKDAERIERLMVETFPSQRRDMLSGLKETQEIVKEWPFLFREAGMRIHFRELTGIQINDGFEDSTVAKFRRVLRYFQSIQTKPSNTAGNETCAAVLMLLDHFREQPDKMFLHVSDTDVDTTRLPCTPCIGVCGDSPLTAKTFMVAVDQVIISEQLPSFTKAFHMMFCSYYLHNIDYPVELAATLEFFQRCIFKLNPDQGTKVSRKQKRHQHIINPRVQSLISKLGDFEWRE